MARYDHHDIMMELVELSRDLRAQIAQQLNYYRASVYKHETAAAMEKKIQQLNTVADIIGDIELLDAFSDYDATRRNADAVVLPGECLLTLRTMNLIHSIDEILNRIMTDQSRRSTAQNTMVSRSLQKNRQKILAICRQDSRQWSFFSSF